MGALRRFEGADLTLRGPSDIVEEVEGGWPRVRQQARKARRYKELADRLQELRIHVGWSDWRQLTERLTAVETEIGTLRGGTESATAQAEAVEAHGLELETAMAQIEGRIRSSEPQAAGNRERLGAPGS